MVSALADTVAADVGAALPGKPESFHPWFSRIWALTVGFEIGSDGTIPGQAITAYNQTHPDDPN